MRVNRVEKARKSPGTCGNCGKEIPAGEGYLWWKGRYTGKSLRCLKCPRPRPSETESNDKAASLLAAQEELEDAVDAFRKDHDLSGLQGAVESAAASIHEVAEMYRESAQNIEDGFGHETEQSSEFNDKADTVESQAEEIEGLSLEDFDEDGGEEGETKEQRAEREEEWVEEQASTVEDAASNIEVP